MNDHDKQEFIKLEKYFTDILAEKCKYFEQKFVTIDARFESSDIALGKAEEVQSAKMENLNHFRIEALADKKEYTKREDVGRLERSVVKLEQQALEGEKREVRLQIVEKDIARIAVAEKEVGAIRTIIEGPSGLVTSISTIKQEIRDTRLWYSVGMGAFILIISLVELGMHFWRTLQPVVGG